jgi:hypothetical protein
MKGQGDACSRSSESESFSENRHPSWSLTMVDDLPVCCDLLCDDYLMEIAIGTLEVARIWTCHGLMPLL